MQALPEAIAERLGVTNEHVFPAFEDVYYYLWRERRLPGNVDPFDSRVDDALERERLMKVFTQGLTIPSVTRAADHEECLEPAWQTGPWFLRAERCYLFPAIRRWAIACRSTRNRGRHRATIPTSMCRTLKRRRSTGQSCRAAATGYRPTRSARAADAG
jgi:hypothetical protein